MNYKEVTNKALNVIENRIKQEQAILKLHARDTRLLFKEAINNSEAKLNIVLVKYRSLLKNNKKNDEKIIRDIEQRYLFQRQRLETLKKNGSDDTIDLGKYFDTLILTSNNYDDLFQEINNVKSRDID